MTENNLESNSISSCNSSYMRISALHTPVAILRNALKMKTQEFATLVGCGLSTLEKLETGRLKLSESMAKKIGIRTGASWRWLHDGNYKAPVINSYNQPYGIVDFEKAQRLTLREWNNTDIIKYGNRLQRALEISILLLPVLIPVLPDNDVEAVEAVSKFVKKLAHQFGKDEEDFPKFARNCNVIFERPDGKAFRIRLPRWAASESSFKMEEAAEIQQFQDTLPETFTPPPVPKKLKQSAGIRRQ